MSTVTYPHIEFETNGVPIIAGTTTKVVQIVQDHLAHHWDAEDLQMQYPFLTRAQIHAALTFYYDHQQAMDDDIEQRWRRVMDIKAKRADNTVKGKLSRMGYLP